MEVKSADGSAAPLGVDRSKEIWEYLKSEGYIDAKGRVQDSLRTDLKAGDFNVPEGFKEQEPAITQILRKLAGRLEIKNADERRQVRPRQSILQSEEFKALWDRIKHKTTYRVAFDNEKLIEDCIDSVRQAPPISKARLEWRLAGLSIGKSGVEAKKLESSMPVALDETDIELPDLLTDLQDRTHLTRRTVQRILSASQRLDDFKRNPQEFIEMTANSINRCERNALVDGIKYQKLGDEHYYAQELFEQEELTGYLKNMLMDTQKSVFEHVVYDSEIESSFADQLEKNDSIKVYGKLPGWFQIPTPLGAYNPDWAVLVETDEGERLYFVVETKSSLFKDDLRVQEGGKIECGKAHFQALATGDTPAQYIPATSINELFARAQHKIIRFPLTQVISFSDSTFAAVVIRPRSPSI